MIRSFVPALLWLLLCACGGGKQIPKDVSAPAKPPKSELTDTLPVKVTTNDVPDNVVVLSTANAEEKTNEAMNHVILRLKGELGYKPQKPAGDAVLDTGGPFNMKAQTKKTSYVTGLSGSGVLFDEDIFVRIEIVSLGFLAYAPDSAREGRLESVAFPTGIKQLKIGEEAGTVNGKKCFNYECVMGLKVLGMLEDGTYATQIAYVPGMVVITDDFKMKLKVR